MIACLWTLISAINLLTKFLIYFCWVVGWVEVWGVWAVPGLVWIGLCRFCCGVAVGGQFAGGQSSVFHRSPSLLVRWVDAWGCGGERASAWASSGRGQLQQACGVTSV